MQFAKMIMASALAAASVASAAVASYSNSTTVVVAPVINIFNIIGYETVIYVNIIEITNYIGGQHVTSLSTATRATSVRPVYQSNPGYPCYSCALVQLGYSCPTTAFLRVTATIVEKAPVPTTYKPVVQTCGTCKPITLSAAPVCDTVYYSSVYMTPVTQATHTAPYVTTLTCTTCAPVVAPPTATPVTDRLTPVSYTATAAVVTPAKYSGAAVANSFGAGAVVLAVAAML